MIRPYLNGLRFTTRTDYQSLHWILVIEQFTGRLARRWFKQTELDFEIVFWPGKYYRAADTMFSLPQKAAENKKQSANVDNDSLAYCIVGLLNESHTAPVNNE